MHSGFGTLLLIVALVLLPFNGLPLHIFGEGSKEGALYPLLLLVTLFLFRMVLAPLSNKRLKIGRSSLIFLALSSLFLLHVFFVFLLNFETIDTVQHMGRTGMLRFFQQLAQLLLGFLIVFSIAFYIKDEASLHRIVKALIYIVTFYILFAFFQFLAYTVQGPLLEPYMAIGKYLYPEGLVEFAIERRHALHSVSQEPSFLSMFFAFAAPFIMVYSLQKHSYTLLFFMVLTLILSFSRTGYVIFFLEFFLALFFMKYKFISTKRLIFSVKILFPILLVILFTPLSDVFLSLFDVENNGSNAARYAAAYSALKVWINGNPLIGVGLGQTGFHSIPYLPDWGFLSNDVWDTFNEIRWPPIHNLLIRILAETGIIGLLLWITIFLFFLVSVHRVIYLKYRRFHYQDGIGYAIFIAIIGTFLIMFNRELFTNMIVWITFGIALGYLKVNERVIYEKTSH